jgi:hypothetical protein
MTKSEAVNTALIDFTQCLTVLVASQPTEFASYDDPYLSETQTWRC